MKSATTPTKLALNQETLRLLNSNSANPNFGTNVRTKCVQCDTLQLGCTI
jgi:hypothetical protein